MSVYRTIGPLVRTLPEYTCNLMGSMHVFPMVFRLSMNLHCLLQEDNTSMKAGPLDECFRNMDY